MSFREIKRDEEGKISANVGILRFVWERGTLEYKRIKMYKCQVEKAQEQSSLKGVHRADNEGEPMGQSLSVRGDWKRNKRRFRLKEREGSPVISPPKKKRTRITASHGLTTNSAVINTVGKNCKEGTTEGSPRSFGAFRSGPYPRGLNST